MALEISNQYRFTGRGPFDEKSLVKTYTDLLTEVSWLSKAGNNIAYNGMIVAVWLNKTDPTKNGVYYLYDHTVTNTFKAPDVTKEANWHKLVEIADLTEKLAAIDSRFNNDEQINKAISDVDAKFASYTTTAVQEQIDAEQDRRIKAIEDDYLVEADIADFETKENVQKVATDLSEYEAANNARVAAIEDEIDTFGDIITHNVAEFATKAQGDKADAADAAIKTYGDIVTHNASEFETAGAAAEVEGRINTKFTSYYTKDEADAAFTTPAEVIAEVNKALSEVSDADTITNITTLVEYVNEHGGDLTELITEVYGSAEMTGDSRIDAIEAKAAMGITADDIAAWNAEKGVKAVVDANKATWDKASTALQTADLNGYALETYVDQAEADAVTEAARDAATKYETIGTAQGIIDGLKLSETYEHIGAETRAKSYTDAELSDFNTETVAPIAARVKAIEDAPYATTATVATAKQEAIDAAKEYADGLPHKDTTYTVAATENALEFTVTPSEGDAQTVKLVAPTVDVGVTKVTSASADIIVTPAEGTGAVTVAHKEYETGTVKDAAHDSNTDPSFITGISIENGHVTGATVRNLAEVLEAMEFILDCGKAE